MIILRPGFQEISLGLVLVMGSSAIWGGAMLIIKSLARTDSSVSIAAYMAILMTPMSLIPALFFWQMPTLEEYVGLFVIGAFGSIGHVMLAQAFKEAEASAILPLDFTRLIWAAAVGYFLFGEVPGLWTWLGGGLIFSAATYVAYRESRAR
jgi:drug/metabolite transporter (DMT)-like permease